MPERCASRTADPDRTRGADRIRYTINATPTRYSRRQYRSRLEAHWAAFFDLLRWNHDYEPFLLAHWLPDFRLRGAAEYPVFVEIKPIEELHRPTWERIWQACCDDGLTGGLLLCGSAPILSHDVLLGWYAPLTPSPSSDWPAIRPSWARVCWHANRAFLCDGWHSASLAEELHDFADHTVRLWEAASATVDGRWEAPA